MACQDRSPRGETDKSDRGRVLYVSMKPVKGEARMFWIDLLFAVAVALVFGLLLVGVVRWRPPRRPDAPVWPSYLFVFLLMLLMVWAGGAWLTPVGPPLWGGYWLTFVLVGLFTVLLLAAVGSSSSRRPPRTLTEARLEAEEEAEAEAVAGTIFGVFFWLLLLFLAASLLIRYLAGPM